jgi:hypothetical protein
MQKNGNQGGVGANRKTSKNVKGFRVCEGRGVSILLKYLNNIADYSKGSYEGEGTKELLAENLPNEEVRRHPKLRRSRP